MRHATLGRLDGLRVLAAGLAAAAATLGGASCRTAAIEALSLAPNDTVLRVGDVLPMTVTLTATPDAPLTVRLFTSDQAVVTIEAAGAVTCDSDGSCAVDVPAGSFTADFGVRARGIGMATLTASVGPTSVTADTQVLEAKFIYDSGTPGVDSAVGADSGTTGTDSGGAGTDAVPGTDSTVAPVCSALSFDGTADSVTVDLLAATITADVTIEAWVNFTGPMTGLQTLVGNQMSGATLRANGDMLELLVDGTTGVTSAPAALTAGAWHHVAGTFDPLTMIATVFVDGVSVGVSAALLTTTDLTGVLVLGADANGMMNELDGLVDSLRISTVVRYTAGFSPMPLTADASTFALWLFDEGAGVTALDSSGNGHDGVVNGAAYVTMCMP
jgi:hypothetical protein